MDLNKFDEINHQPLRAFNRTVFLNNLYQDGGEGAAKRYISLFTEEEKKEMFVINACIKKMGVERVKKEVTKGLVVVDQDYE